MFCASRKAALTEGLKANDGLAALLGSDVTHKEIMRALGAEWKAYSNEAKAVWQAAFQLLH